MITPGKYTAKIVDYGVATTNAGDPIIVVKFSFDNGHTLAWRGSLKEGKAQEITLKSLVRMGLTDDSRVADLADGIPSGLLDMNKDLQIDVQNETFNGKMYTKIKWVNEIGVPFKNIMNKGEFKNKIGALNLKGALKSARDEMGVKPAAPTVAEASIDDIPF